MLRGLTTGISKILMKEKKLIYKGRSVVAYGFVIKAQVTAVLQFHMT